MLVVIKARNSVENIEIMEKAFNELNRLAPHKIKALLEISDPHKRVAIYIRIPPNLVEKVVKAIADVIVQG